MKKAFVFLLALALLLCAAPGALAFRVQLSSQSMKVDGKPVECQAYNIDDSNYLKLRDVAMLLNGTESQFSVTYDEASRTVQIVTGEAYVPVGGELAPGEDLSDTARPSGQTILLNGREEAGLRAYNIGGEAGQNYFMLRDLGKALGFGVEYDEASRTVLVSTGKSAPAEARLGLTQDAGREYLDKIVFLGDSTTYGIGYYYRHGYTDLCPPSQVWTPKNGTMTLSYYATAKIVYPATGTEMLIADAAAQAKPEIMVITLGVNGISFMDKDWFIRDYTALVESIREASPDTKIILNSIYPVADSYALQKSINNTKINAANVWIEQVAKDTGVRFLYSFEAVEKDGKLPESLQNGDGLHLTGEAFGLVMEYIRTHALP